MLGRLAVKCYYSVYNLKLYPLLTYHLNINLLIIYFIYFFSGECWKYHVNK